MPDLIGASSITDDRTAKRDIPMPSTNNLLSDDVQRLRAALVRIDQELEDAEILTLALGGN